MGKFVNSVEEFFKYTTDNEVEFVDFRFTDMKGTWHHLTYTIESISAESFTNGIPFDGSSIDAWQPINKSDMLLNLKQKQHFWIHLRLILPLLFSVMFLIFTKVNSMRNAQEVLLKKH